MIKIIVLTLMLQACSLSDVMNLVKPSSGISVDTEIVAGDKQQEVNTEVGTEVNTYTAETIVNNVSEAASVWWIVFGVIGWMAPSPANMYRIYKRRPTR